MLGMKKITISNYWEGAARNILDGHHMYGFNCFTEVYTGIQKMSLPYLISSYPTI